MSVKASNFSSLCSLPPSHSSLSLLSLPPSHSSHSLPLTHLTHSLSLISLISLPPSHSLPLTHLSPSPLTQLTPSLSLISLISLPPSHSLPLTHLSPSPLTQLTPSLSLISLPPSHSSLSLSPLTHLTPSLSLISLPPSRSSLSLSLLSHEYYISSPASPKFTMFPTDLDLLYGTTATIPCAFNGFPKPSVEWRKNRQTLGSQSNRVKITSCATSSILEIVKLCYEDVASYTCFITNSRGSNSAQMSLNVHGEPSHDCHMTVT